MELMTIRRWILRACLVYLCVSVPVVSIGFAQSQETINATVNQRLAQLEVKHAAEELLRTESRLRVLENDAAEIKWLGRSVALVVAGQLVTMLLGLKDRRRE